ncbi:MAG TPA: hypothetical protein DCS04_06270 [Ruminococcaceae bacterium]|nr:hypothetical protein [Oscillospiraceae bacterium]
MKSKLTDEGKEKPIAIAVLTVLIVIMSLTPLGYLKMPHASITFLPLLVVIGAVQYGPMCGLYLGTVFGISSFIHCFDPSYTFGQTFIHISPFLSLLVCIIPRALMGLSCGLIHKLFSRNTSQIFANIISSFSGGFLNTVFFVAALLLAFYSSDYIQNLGSNPTRIIRTLITYNAYIEWLVCTVIGTLVPCIKTRLKQKNNPDGVEAELI